MATTFLALWVMISFVAAVNDDARGGLWIVDIVGDLIYYALVALPWILLLMLLAALYFLIRRAFFSG